MEKDWRTWDRVDWGERLLAHFFGRSRGGGPVAHLVVTDEELVRVVGIPTSDPKEVTDRFVEVLKNSTGRNTDKPLNWLEKAGQNREHPKYYFAFLVHSCLIATGSDDPDEGSFIARLDDALKPIVVGDYAVLAELWRELREWLDSRGSTFRPLHLPDQGGWNRIGYTVKLAFPKRNDLLKLRECLESGGALDENTSISETLAAIGRSGFSPKFKEFLDKFQERRRTGAPLSALRSMALWDAVQTARRFEPAGSTAGEKRIRWALVVSDDGYDLGLTLVSNQAVSEDPLELREDTLLDAPWSHVGTIGGDISKAVEAALSGDSKLLGELSRLIKGGVVPIVEGLNGSWESCNTVVDSVGFLIRAELVSAFLSIAVPVGRQRQSGYTGWEYIEGARVVQRPEEELPQPLQSSAVLSESLPSPQIRLRSGMRCGDSYLGLRGYLPAVVAAGSDQCLFETQESDESPLNQTDDGVWAFPVGVELNGEVRLKCNVSDYGPIERTVHFVGSPDSEKFKSPRNLGGYVYERHAVSRNYEDRWIGGDSLATVEDATESILLGRDVGVFVEHRDDATWEIFKAGDSLTLVPLKPPAERQPLARNPNGGQCRKWRRYLQQAGVGRSVDGLGAAVGTSGPVLPKTATSEVSAPELALVASPHPKLAAVITAVVAMGNNRAGLERVRVRDLLRSALALDLPTAELTLRAWQEAELIDELCAKNWSSRMVLPLQPFLALFLHTDGTFQATLRGLTLSSTLHEIRITADELDGVDSAQVPSRSPFVPASLLLRSKSLSPLEELAERHSLRLVPLAESPFEEIDGLERYNEPVLAGRELSSSNALGAVLLQRYWKHGGPALWTVEGPKGKTWSYFQNAARWWAHVLAYDLSVRHQTSTAFSVSAGLIPLEAARWLSRLGSVISGPSTGIVDSYDYVAPSPAVLSRFLTELSAFNAGELARIEVTGLE